MGAEEAFCEGADVPMSKNVCYSREIRQDQRIKLPHDVAFQAAMNFLV